MTKSDIFFVPSNIWFWKVQINIDFIFLLVKSPTPVYGWTDNVYFGTYSTSGEADNINGGQIVYNKGQIVYI